MSEQNREAFEAWYADHGGPQRMHESYPPDYVEEAEKDAAWSAWSAASAGKAQLLEALKVAQQAVMEMDHAYRNPRWFTNGESGAFQQFRLWRDKANDAVAAAIRAAEGKD